MGKRVATCRPKKWNVISGPRITYGWKCPFHHEHGKRYVSEELRDQRMDEHIRDHSEKVKK